MPKRPSSRRKRPSNNGWLTPALLLAILVVVAWWLFHPVLATHKHRAVEQPPVAVATETAVPETQSALPETTETPSSEASATPSASPERSPAATPSAPSPAAANGPKLALIIDDCGQWITTERGFVALPIPLTLSVLPDVHYNATIAREASDAGKGVMLHLPMETLSGMNPGPGKVTTEMTDAEIDAQVEADLAQIPLAQGVNNHEGSKASADSRVMHDVIGVLSKHGNLFFVDSKTSSASVGESTATAEGVPTAARDVFLDNKADVAYSEAQLREAAAIAKRSGSAIAIGHPRPSTLEAVRALIPELQADGITFVLAQTLTH